MRPSTLYFLSAGLSILIAATLATAPSSHPSSSPLLSDPSVLQMRAP
ncbi:MAG TPA: hypothetical protein V6C57_14805 [Coleofasciculaceae cyanobacterium]